MSTALRSLFRIRYRTAILLFVLAMILWSGFSYWSEYRENSARLARELLSPPVGVNCSILLTGEAGVAHQGKIVEQSDRWIVLQKTPPASGPSALREQIWINRERVAAIIIQP